MFDALMEKKQESQDSAESIPTNNDISPNPSARGISQNALDWDGPNDLDNPKNWTLASKIYHTVIPALLGFTVTFGTSVYTPGITQIAKNLHISREVAILGLSLYSEGLAFGPVIGAPISETKGRRAVYLITIPISLLFTLGAGLAKNPATLIACRFLAGTFGAPALAVGAGTIADVWDMQHGGGLATVLITWTFFLGPSLGPLIGGFTMKTRNNWKWLMWVTLLVTGPVFLTVLFSKETSKKQILRARARKRNLPEAPKPPMAASLKVLLVITLYRPIRMLLVEPIVASITLYNAFAFGVLFAFFDSYPYVFEAVYGFDSSQVGLAFIGLLIGTVLAVLTFIVMDKTFYAKARRAAPPGHPPPPEERLYTAMVGSVGIPLALFWFAWTARSSIHWIVPMLAGIPFGWGIVALFLGTMTYLVDTYGALYSASAIAANGLVRYTFGAVFPLFTIQMYDKLGIAWAGSLLGFIGLVMVPIPWVLYRWGPFLRSKSYFQYAS